MFPSIDYAAMLSLGLAVACSQLRCRMQCWNVLAGLRVRVDVTFHSSMKGTQYM